MWKQIRIVVVSVAIIATGESIVTQADARHQPITMACSLPSESMLGEPLVLECTVENQSGDAVWVDFGWNRIGQFQLELQASGSALQRARPSATGLGGVSSSGKVEVLPGAHYVQRLLLNEWLEWSRPGMYALRVHFGGTISTSVGDVLEIVRDYALPFRLRPGVPGELSRVAESLLKKATLSSAAQDRIEAARSLSFMRDPAALPCLRRLALLRLWPGDAIAGIERVGTEEASRILTELSGSTDPDIASRAKASEARLKSRRK